LTDFSAFMSLLARAVYLGALLLAFAGLPQSGREDHPRLRAAPGRRGASGGRPRARRGARGDTVKIVVVTNGDAQTGGVDTA